jgi:hypothetical protein
MPHARTYASVLCWILMIKPVAGATLMNANTGHSECANVISLCIRDGVCHQILSTMPQEARPATSDQTVACETNKLCNAVLLCVQPPLMAEPRRRLQEDIGCQIHLSSLSSTLRHLVDPCVQDSSFTAVVHSICTVMQSNLQI